MWSIFISSSTLYQTESCRFPMFSGGRGRLSALSVGPICENYLWIWLYPALQHLRLFLPLILKTLTHRMILRMGKWEVIKKTQKWVNSVTSARYYLPLIVNRHCGAVWSLWLMKPPAVQIYTGSCFITIILCCSCWCCYCWRFYYFCCCFYYHC